MSNLNPSSPVVATSTPARRPEYGFYFFLALTAVWIGLVTAGTHALAWFADQTALSISDRALPAWFWLLAAWGHGALLALPLAPLAISSARRALGLFFRPGRWRRCLCLCSAPRTSCQPCGNRRPR
jgi:hypothetical protein